MPRRPDQSDGSDDRRKREKTPAPPAPSLSQATPDISILPSELQTALRRLNGKYDPMYAIAVLALMAQGASIAEVSLRLRVPFGKIRKWREEHDEFREAFEDGGVYALGWWEAMGRANITDKNFNSTLWLMQMVNRFGYIRGEGVISGGGNQQPAAQITFTKDTHNHLHCDLTKLSKGELQSMADTLRKARGGSANNSGWPTRKAIGGKETQE